MGLLTHREKKQLLLNAQIGNLDYMKPVVKLYNKKRKITWLIYEMKKETGLICGLYGVGLEMPIIKSHPINMVENPTFCFTKDKKFKPKHSMLTYFSAARTISAIVEDLDVLDIIAQIKRNDKNPTI